MSRVKLVTLTRKPACERTSGDGGALVEPWRTRSRARADETAFDRGGEWRRIALALGALYTGRLVISRSRRRATARISFLGGRAVGRISLRGERRAGVSRAYTERERRARQPFVRRENWTAARDGIFLPRSSSDFSTSDLRFVFYNFFPSKPERRERVVRPGGLGVLFSGELWSRTVL